MEIKLKDGTRVICGLLVAISFVFYYITYSFPKERGLTASAYGSAFFPRIILLFIIVVSIVLFLQTTFRKAKPFAEAMISLDKVQLARSFSIWGLCLLFYWAWQYLGYLYASPVFLLVVALLLGPGKWKRLVLLVAVAPLMYLIFEHFLKVGL